MVAIVHPSLRHRCDRLSTRARPGGLRYRRYRLSSTGRAGTTAVSVACNINDVTVGGGALDYGLNSFLTVGFGACPSGAQCRSLRMGKAFLANDGHLQCAFWCYCQMLLFVKKEERTRKTTKKAERISIYTLYNYERGYNLESRVKYLASRFSKRLLFFFVPTTRLHRAALPKDLRVPAVAIMQVSIQPLFSYKYQYH